MYPYTKIKFNQTRQFYDLLYNFGYTPGFNIEYFLTDCIVLNYIGDIFIVINDTGVFGSFCFYTEGKIDPTIQRTFIKDPYKFLKKAAKYKNCVEY